MKGVFCGTIVSEKDIYGRYKIAWDDGSDCLFYAENMKGNIHNFK